MSKIKLYFLIHAKAFYPSWKSFLTACLNDTRNITTKVIYCPVKKLPEGRMGQFDGTEKWLKENNIKYIHIKKINLFFDRPDVLVYQTPYTHHRKENLSSTRLKNLGLNLIYISYGLEFTEAPQNIKDHFKLPIYKDCWRVFTFSKNNINDYGKYCPIGNRHIRCVGHPKFDALYDAKNIKMPEWLKKKAAGRKIICWHPHFPCKNSIVNNKKIISTFPWDENKKMLEYIKHDKENFYIFMPHHMFWGRFEVDFNIPKEELKEFKNQLQFGENSTIWEGEYPEVLSWSDVFLGERSAVTMEMITTGKPVIYLENCPEIYNQFGKDVISSYYYATNANEAIDYLKQIKNENDYKKQEREKIFKEYISPYWDGKCGERIKEEILSDYSELLESRKKIYKVIIKYFFQSFIDFFYAKKIHARETVVHNEVTILGVKFKYKNKKLTKNINKGE